VAYTLPTTATGADVAAARRRLASDELAGGRRGSQTRPEGPAQIHLRRPAAEGRHGWPDPGIRHPLQAGRPGRHDPDDRPEAGRQTVHRGRYPRRRVDQSEGRSNDALRLIAIWSSPGFA